ncbi:hypothetical protein HPB50_007574 [Hyalomma asiaticum]|uniref:Uncharacterized protein n=1 Tax=Hyalomma asiaticum TaxID=266040 RepID=A0ACB7S102_HYAAI|nr:hypothetical protein HPB50_007574 [Hyalomma asiaticum]
MHRGCRSGYRCQTLLHLACVTEASQRSGTSRTAADRANPVPRRPSETAARHSQHLKRLRLLVRCSGTNIITLTADLLVEFVDDLEKARCFFASPCDFAHAEMKVVNGTVVAAERGDTGVVACTRRCGVHRTSYRPPQLTPPSSAEQR